MRRALERDRSREIGGNPRALRKRPVRCQIRIDGALLPPAKPRGRKPTDPRAILNALFYPVRAGCPWRYLPSDFLSFTTVQNRFLRAA
jgi:transposase